MSKTYSPGEAIYFLDAYGASAAKNHQIIDICFPVVLGETDVEAARWIRMTARQRAAIDSDSTIAPELVFLYLEIAEKIKLLLTSGVLSKEEVLTHHEVKLLRDKLFWLSNLAAGADALLYSSPVGGQK